MLTFRRIVASLGIVIGCILLVLALLIAVAQSSRVQTAAVGLLLSELEQSLGTEADVAEVNYSFPNRLLIRGVYLEDQLADTLLYADTLQARFDFFALLRDDMIAFRRVDLAHVRLYAHPIYVEADSGRIDSVMNYQFLADAFRPDPNREKRPLPIRLEVKDVTIRDASLQYASWLVRLHESSLALNHLSVDSLDAEVGSMALRLMHCDAARSGGGAIAPDADAFTLRTFRGRVILAGGQLRLPELYLAAPRSQLHATDMSLHLGDSAFLDPSSPVSFRMKEAHLSPSDLVLFAPRLRNFRGYLDMRAHLEGRIDSLHAADLSLSYNDQRLLLGDVQAIGLPLMDSLRFRAECRDLFVNKALLQDLISGLKGQPFVLPKPVARLGDMHYRGSVTGNSHNMTLHGVFTSALGNITTNGTALIDSAYSSLAFTGDVATRRFALGRLLDVPDLGAASLWVHADGRVVGDQPFAGTVHAKVEQLTYRDYAYEDLEINGAFRNKVFTGTMSSDDENLNLAFNGSIDFNRTAPTYDFTLRLRHFRPGELHLSDKYADADLSFLMRLQAKGKTVDSFTGILSVDSLSFHHNGQTLFMKELALTAQHGLPGLASDVIRLQSDYLNASFAGSYRMSTLPTTFKKLLLRYVPRAFSVASHRRILASPSDNDADFYAYFHDWEHVTSVLELPIEAGGTPVIKGFVHETTGQVGLQALISQLRAGNQNMEDVALSLDNSDDRINLSLAALRHHGETIAAEHVGDMNLLLSAHAVSDSLAMVFSWSNIDTVHNAGSIRLTTHFGQYAAKPLVGVHLYPTQLLLGDSLWMIDDAHITYSMADTALQVEHFALHSASQFLRADGIASRLNSDSIRIELQQIDIDYFLEAFTDVHNAIFFGGTISGWATAYGVFRDPVFEADLEMLHAHINGCEVGDVYARASLDERNHVIINGECYELMPDSARKRTIEVLGDIGGPDHAWDLRIRPDSVQACFIGYWVKGILDDMDGRASGDVHVWGKRPKGVKRPTVRVTVAAKPHEVGFVLPFTGARYYTSDSIILDTNAVHLRQIHLHDALGHPLFLDGGVYHNGDWENLSYHFDIHADKAEVMNLTESTEQMYAGRIFATGDVRVDGTNAYCNVTATARTEQGSNVIITTGGSSTASASDFITFVSDTLPLNNLNSSKSALNSLNSSQSTSTRRSAASSRRKAASSPFALNLDLMIEATPDIEARVVIDPRTGDQLRGRGEGNLRLSFSTSDGLNMFGSYTLQQGTFSFTLQNVIRREFEIAAGSSVTWQGPAAEPIIDVHAIYHLTASLRDLFGTDAQQLYTNRSSVPVNCILNLSGVLKNPIIRFGIDLPSSEESIASQVRSVINTDDMLTRQVLYLLVFNRFYTPEYLQNSSRVGLNETFSLLSSTVTGQINNWLGKITNMFTLGFNIRTDGEGATASQEYEAQFEIQPVRGLLINGNFGYRYNDISNQPIFGNLDVEYMLTPDGKLRAKAYTHTVDKYSLRQANTVQGLGLVFKHDFNWPQKDTTAHKSTTQSSQPSAQPSQPSAQPSQPSPSDTTALEPPLNDNRELIGR